MLPLPLLAPEPWLLPLALIVLGASSGAMDVSMNAHGVAVERVLHRPIMSSLHAGWSFGGLAGAALVAAGGGAGIDPRVETLIATGLFLLLLVVCLRRLGEGSATAEAPSGFVRPTRGVVMLAVLCLIVMVTEGAMADWGGIYLTRDLGTSTAVAALAFAAFSGGMTAARVFGDWLNRRLGAATLFQGGSALAGIALGGMLLAGDPVVAIAGFFLVGIGVANGVPLVFSAAGHAPGESGPNIAAVSSMGSLGLPRRAAVHRLPGRGDLAAARALDPVPRAGLRHRGRAQDRRRRRRTERAGDGGRAMRYVLSDLDGVLVDSGAEVERVWREWAAERGIDPDLVARESHGVPGARRARARGAGAQHAGGDRPHRAPPRGDRRPRRCPAPPSCSPAPTPWSPRAARSWPPRASRPPACTAPAVLITSDLTERGKPHPDPYLAGAAALGADPADCLVIEDAPAGIQAARAAGMTVWAVTTTHAPDELAEADRVLLDAVEHVGRAVEVALLGEVHRQ